MLEDEDKLEKVARKLCELRSVDPDGLSELIVDANGTPTIQPLWKAYVREIKLYLQLQLAIDLIK